MELTDAIKLIKYDDLYTIKNAVWSDLGSGTGLFTYALANLLSPGGIIYSIDKVKTLLKAETNPNNILIRQQELDFEREALQLSGLDGILMANSLHYVKDQPELIIKLGKSLKENGNFLVVEYDTDRANPWVPFPRSFNSLKMVFKKAGYTGIEKLHEMPSAFGRSNIYSAFISR